MAEVRFQQIPNKKAEAIEGIENALLQLMGSFFTVALFVGIQTGYHFSIGTQHYLPILLLGFGSTGIGCYLYFSSIGKLPAQSVALLGYLEPLAAVLCSTLFLHETLNQWQIIGCLLVVSGILLNK